MERYTSLESLANHLKVQRAEIMARNSKGVLGFLKIHTSKSVFVRIVVLGAQDVGKTALIVRFLTKKYVHEYIRGELHTYDRRVTVENRDFDIVLIDTPGSSHSCSDTDRHSYNIGKTHSPPARQDFHPGPEKSNHQRRRISSSDNSIQSCIAHDMPAPTEPKTNHSCSNPSQVRSLTSLTEFSSPLLQCKPTAA
ncbi:Ras-like protein family member 11B like protein [Argiope bruennichi]|uniref:small monomeric GTPase n=1 Tax=Argiope bruennichi TaxID=94029 RepID=A0A8T0F3F1_ARGBR|nr:Ras-like protein family member 11B like protein [Argiope bruennichi]